MNRTDAHGYGIRGVEPSVWPQYPYDGVPKIPESSPPTYTISQELGLSIEMRDGVRLLLDVFRPSKPGAQFPALCSFSPYSRQLQQDSAPIGQNEAGITEFWVPRGYAHVIVDVRGTNGSGGDWDMWGPLEQRDMVETIEWVASQPWCSGRVGMMGCSYFAMVQNQVAAARPPSLRAIFPYDAATDIYRDGFYPGGIPSEWSRFWFTQVNFLNGSSGRNPNMEGVRRHVDDMYAGMRPFDGDYYRDRSAWPAMDNIDIPVYFGCDWDFYTLHLRGAFDGWQRVQTSPTKRMLIGPKPFPGRPFGAYHGEALRWYDAMLKDLDTGILDGSPVQLYIRGDEVWRSEYEWPLSRARFEEWPLTVNGDELGIAETPGTSGEVVCNYDPTDEASNYGLPKLVFRSEPIDGELEVTGPVQLTLAMSSTAEDTDWIAVLGDEAPDGSSRELSRGHLRSSHRALDPAQSRPNEPWHPHDRAEPLVPGRTEELAIEIVATSNVFKAGHRLRLELANCDSKTRKGTETNYRRALVRPARNSVLTGRGMSRLSIPIVPR